MIRKSGVNSRQKPYELGNTVTPERETRTERPPVDEALSLSGRALKIKSPSVVRQHNVLRSLLQCNVIPFS